jgi:thiamine-monophosphate kinase
LGSKIATGIGDDCGVLRIPKDHEMLVTTDFSLEAVHFRREHPPKSVGQRCLARGLSDIAAMGGDPVAVFLSLALPAKIPQRWVDGFMGGLLALAANFEVELAGGDTAESPSGILADIVVVGSVPRGKAILRSKARPGNRIYVSGALGGSAAALDLIYSKRRKKLMPNLYPEHFFPTPQIKLGQILRKRGIASAMIDISDGFSTDLAHICEESGVGAEVREEAVPRAKIGQAAGPVDLSFVLHGGEDYQLLFTADRGQKVPSVIAGIAITEVGVITRNKDILLIDGKQRRSKLKPLGWEHFRKPSRA